MSELNGDNDALKHDPDYFVPEVSNEQNQNVFEENARSSTVKKISAIIEKEFMKEIDNKKTEIKNIYKTLTKATKTMHYLRYAIVADYYHKDKCTDSSQSTKQCRPHPTVNAPKRKVPYDDMEDQYKCWEELGVITESKRLAAERAQNANGSSKDLNDKRKNVANDKAQPEGSRELEVVAPSASTNYKTRKRIVVGNLSKWIHPEYRGKNNATHKWTIYVMDVEKKDLGEILSKVRFFLHPSYKPNDVVDVTSSPFTLARLGWGEFPVRIQLHFVNSMNKPVDIIHQLKLDQTYTGLQTCGAETVIEMLINTRGSASTSTATINLEDSLEKSCDDDNANSDLASLLSRINDKQSHVTIHHDLPADHDYVNINSKISQESSNDLAERSDVNSTVTKADSEQESVFKENTIVEEEKSKLVEANNEIPKNLKPLRYLSKEEITEALVHLLNHAKPDNLSNLLRIVASKTPMITEKALDPQYKAQHPFATESYAVYSSYSAAKQSSLERQRAIRALEILSKSKHKIDLSVRDFVTWARKYGYTPISNGTSASKKSIDVDDDGEKEVEASTTVMEEASRWIQDLESKPRSSNLDDNDGEADGDEIDVTGVERKPTKPRRRCIEKSDRAQMPRKKTMLYYVEHPETKSGMLKHVLNVTSRRGIELPLEQAVPGVWHATSSLLIAKAVECFVDEILRLSHSCAVDRCDKDAIVIDAEDVKAALLKREEFEILTNSGLGTDE